MKSTSKIFLATIMIVLLGACQTFSQSTTTATSVPTQQTQSLSLSSQNPDVQQQQDRLVEIYQQINPGVVTIQVYSDQGGALGSGFVYDTQGHIITNYHVVSGSTDLEVDFPSGLKVKGKIIATDSDSDLAVIKVDVATDQLHPLTLGDSDKVQVGQTVVAIGNPFGLSSTMTVGIISAKGRTMESLHQSPSGGYFSEGDMLQTDAAINVGNSGGPLVDLNGKVIGINRSIQTSSAVTVGTEPGNIGIGFAIPINIVKHVVPVLISKGTYAYPYLGMTSRDDLTLKELEALGLASDTVGIYVISIASNDPAEKAGIIGGSKDSGIQDLPTGGDVITKVDGIQMHNMSELLSYVISNKNPGDKIVLTILRNNQTKEVTLTLGTRP
jgi:2-alkenal reductase